MKEEGICSRFCYFAFRALLISGSEVFFLVSFRVLRCKARDGHSAKEKGQANFAVGGNFLFFLLFLSVDTMSRTRRFLFNCLNILNGSNSDTQLGHSWHIAKIMLARLLARGSSVGSRFSRSIE